MLPTTRSGNGKLVTGKDGKVRLSKRTEDGMKASGEKREQVGDDRGDRASKVAKKEVKLPTDNMKEVSLGRSERDQDGDGRYRILEQGLIYFFYRPKVQGMDEMEDGKAAESIDEIQSTHMLLIPIRKNSSTASTKDAKGPSESSQKQRGATGEATRGLGVGFRLIRLGKKRLPAPEQALSEGRNPGGIGGDSSETIWAVVSKIGQDAKELSDEMGERRYNTQTRGPRVIGASRPAGRGRYSIILHELEPPSRRGVQVVYALSHPSDMGDVQRQLGLTTSGAVRLMMRNPTLPQTGGQGAPLAGLEEKDRAELSETELDKHFGGSTQRGGRRYGRPEKVELLDRAGVELLMTRERHHERRGGAEQGAGEKQTDALKGTAKHEGESLPAHAVLEELALSSKENPPAALDGEWI